jgi:hypothetical protein
MNANPELLGQVEASARRVMCGGQIQREAGLKAGSPPGMAAPQGAGLRQFFDQQIVKHHAAVAE